MERVEASKKKITYVISDLNYSVAFEWIVREFKDRPYQFYFIFLNLELPELKKSLENQGAFCNYIKLKSGIISHLTAWFKLTKQLNRIKTKTVHCHLFKANLLGLTSAYFLGIKNRIYTRHHSTFHHLHSKKAVTIDRLINGIATEIVAISKNVEEVLVNNEGVDPKKVKRIEHGFDLVAFQEVNIERVEKLKSKYQLPENAFTIGVISRLIDWKGVQYIIPAFKTLLEKEGSAHLVLANATGPDREKILEEVHKLPKESYTLIEFESDIFALYQCFDVFVHVPIDSEVEAFGQTYIEALAAGIPSVFTLSGIANEFIKNEHNALVVPYKNSTAIAESVERLKKSPELSQRLIFNGKTDVRDFSILNMINSLEDLYK